MSSIPTKQIDGDVAVGRNATTGGDVNIQGSARVGHDLVVEGWLEAKNIKSANKGLFATVEALRAAYPHVHEGWFAGVPATDKEISDLGLSVEEGKALYRLYVGCGGEWVCEPLNKLYEITVDNRLVDIFREELTTLRNDHDHLETRVETVETQLNDVETRLTTEETRSQEQDRELAASIAAETSRAERAERSLGDEVVAESTRAQGVEAELRHDLASEQVRAMAKEKEIELSVERETNNRISADEELAASITTEAGRAKAAEQLLNDRIVQLKVDLDVLDHENATEAIESFREILAFLEGISDDETLLAKLTEIKDLITSVAANTSRTDQQLSSAITSETNRAKTTERELGERIDGVNSELGAAIDSEATRAELAEAKLRARIDGHDTELEAAAEDIRALSGRVNAHQRKFMQVDGKFATEQGLFTHLSRTPNPDLRPECGAIVEANIGGVWQLWQYRYNMPDLEQFPDAQSEQLPEAQTEDQEAGVEAKAVPIAPDHNIANPANWVRLATRDDVEAMLAKKQYKRELTFGFVDYNNGGEDWAEYLPDGVWFSRRDGAFYRNRELAEAGDGCYNEVTEDGTVRANTRMVFRCNDTRYRFTGRELVNLNWATGGAMRRVCRVPSLNAHPGLFYLDRGYIAVHASEPCRISLKGLYWMDVGRLGVYPIPLSDLDVTTNYRHQDYGCKAHIEGDELVVEEVMTGDKGHWIHLLAPKARTITMSSNTVIGVRLRPDGGKVFYRTTATHLEHLTLPAPDGYVLLALLTGRVFPLGKYSFKIELCDISSSHKVQYEVWQRSRRRMGSYALKRSKRIWRWKSLTFRSKGRPATKVVRGDRALFRMRMRHKGVWTEWAYFHVRFRPLEDEKVEVTIRRSQPMRLAGTGICSLTEADIDAMFKR